MFVKNEMTPHPVTITPDRPISEAQRLMTETNIRHLPVVTPKGNLVGIVTRTTLNKVMPSKLTSLSVWEINYQLNKITVGEAMVRDVVTVVENMPIEEAARIMLEKKIGCLPVMRGDKLVGIITDIDLMRTMTELLGAREHGVRITLLVPDQEGELCKITSAIAQHGGYISALGTYAADEPLKWWVIVKVRFVDREALVKTFEALPDIELIDVRES